MIMLFIYHNIDLRIVEFKYIIEDNIKIKLIFKKFRDLI